MDGGRPCYYCGRSYGCSCDFWVDRLGHGTRYEDDRYIPYGGCAAPLTEGPFVNTREMENEFYRRMLPQVPEEE